jgi:hypothetical protein
MSLNAERPTSRTAKGFAAIIRAQGMLRLKASVARIERILQEPDGRRRRSFGKILNNTQEDFYARSIRCHTRDLGPPHLMSKSRFLHQAPELVVTKSSARQARKAADLGALPSLG